MATLARRSAGRLTPFRYEVSGMRCKLAADFVTVIGPLWPFVSSADLRPAARHTSDFRPLTSDFPLLPDAVQEFIGANQQSAAVDGGAAVEHAAAFEVVGGELFEFGFRAHDERPARARRVVDAAVG